MQGVDLKPGMLVGVHPAAWISRNEPSCAGCQTMIQSMGLVDNPHLLFLTWPLAARGPMTADELFQLSGFPVNRLAVAR